MAIRAMRLAYFGSVERLEAFGDRDHCRVREAVEDRVLHPVDGVTLERGDRLDLAAARELLVLAAVVRERLRRVVEERRGRPVRLLDLPVLAAVVEVEREDDLLLAAHRLEDARALLGGERRAV